MVQKNTKYRCLLLVLTLALLGLSACGGGKTPEKEKVSAVKCGDWADTKVVAEADGEPHDVTMRITGFVKDPEKVKAAVEEYNLSGTGQTISLPEDAEDAVWVLADYEIRFPGDFPQMEYGIYGMPDTFRIVNEAGEEEFVIDDTVYSGLGQVWQIGAQPQGYDLYPGDTYEGTMLYLMIRDYDGYCVCYEYPEGKTYFKGE